MNAFPVVSAEKKMQQQQVNAPRRRVLLHSRSLCTGDARAQQQSVVQPAPPTLHATLAVHAKSRMTRSFSSPELLPDASRTQQQQQQEPRPEDPVSQQPDLSSSVETNNSAEPTAAAVIIPAHMMDFDVFLAGSCNPTTWRQEVAIPLLDTARVKYYNPQVDDWYEELIAIETHVMETAKVLLIVIDSITRTLVSINEAIEYICRGRRVVLVVDDIAPGTLIEGAAVTPEELVDLNGARACLRSLAVKKQTRLYGTVYDAVQGTIQWLQEDSESSFVCEAPRLWRRVSKVLNQWWSGSRISKSRRRSNTTPRSVSEPRSSVATSQGSGSTVLQHTGCNSSQRNYNYTGGSIYLRGNGAKSASIAVAMLQEAGVPLVTPSLEQSTLEQSRQHGKPKAPSSSSAHHRRDRWRLSPAEKDSGAELILFVIPSHTPSIVAMTDAVELIASGHAVLLVIEPFEEGCVVAKDGRVVSGRKFKDLARARAYLQATAQRNDTQAFASVVDAVKSISQCR